MIPDNNKSKLILVLVIILAIAIVFFGYAISVNNSNQSQNAIDVNDNSIDINHGYLYPIFQHTYYQFIIDHGFSYRIRSNRNVGSSIYCW